MKLGPVGEHEREGVAALEPERAQPVGETIDPVPILLPGDLDVASPGTKRDTLGIATHRLGERLGNGIGAQPRLLGPFFQRRALQISSFQVLLEPKPNAYRTRRL